jgi:hypothetical protein
VVNAGSKTEEERGHGEHGESGTVTRITRKRSEETRVATVQRSSKAEKSTGERISRATEKMHETDGGEGEQNRGSPGRKDALASEDQTVGLVSEGFAVCRRRRGFWSIGVEEQ